MRRRGILAWSLATAGVVGLLILAFRPKPVPVETATVSRGALQETLDEEGKTRIHDHFVVGAPVAGKLRRIQLHSGDHVRSGEVVAWIDPTPLEPRQTAVLQARLEAARAYEKEADALVGRANTEHLQASSDLDRARKLFEQGIISKEAMEKAASVDAGSTKALEAAHSRAQAATHAVEEARAALAGQTGAQHVAPVAVRSPVAGRVLKLLEQSERVLTPGAPILEIGYSPRLEVVAEYLTADAVKIRPGMDAIIDDWGGTAPLHALVRVVEPGAFTKVSALGVEEQRVNVILDPTGDTANLADAYRVEVRVITWRASDALQVPSSALFRVGEQWAVFRVSDGRAQRRIVKVGHHGEGETELLDGLNAGDSVVVYPSSDLKDGARVVRALRASEQIR
jgi:HlyD family secretion protein